MKAFPGRKRLQGGNDGNMVLWSGEHWRRLCPLKENGYGNRGQKAGCKGVAAAGDCGRQQTEIRVDAVRTDIGWTGIVYVTEPSEESENRTDTLVPTPSLLSMTSLAPWSRAISVHRESPSPQPPSFRLRALSAM